MTPTLEYRVEVRRADEDGSAWIADTGRTFTDRPQAEAYLQERAAWYDSPTRWQHRLAVRQVTPWIDAL